MEVHPPEHPIHTWREFFIHISVVVIGLLIAIGLEQTVEFIHHRLEVRETRRGLAEERHENIDAFHWNVVLRRTDTAHMQTNLRIFLYLQQHPGTPLDKLPGLVSWSIRGLPARTTVWNAAQTSGVIPLMPREEVEDARVLYSWLKRAEDANEVFYTLIQKASAYELIDSDISHFTPAQINEEISLIRDCLAEQQTIAIFQVNITQVDVGFAPGPTFAELNLMSHTTITPEEQKKLYPNAYAFSKRDMDAAEEASKDQQPYLKH